MKKGLIHFHQGWTDVINCIPLINYYSQIYDEILTVNLSQYKNIIDFFIKDLTNVKTIYIEQEIHDRENAGTLNLIDYLISDYQINIEEHDILIHGFPDHYRKDMYKSVYPKFFNTIHFVKGFYEFYGIKYSTRINNFDFKRDTEVENLFYENFVKNNGENYILYHEDVSRNFGRSINIAKKEGIKYVNLHGVADNVFNYIKILENAKEIHLIDSVWASFCYMVDAKYKIFSNKNIYIYRLINRPGGCLPHYLVKELEPVNLKNWNIIDFY